MEGCSGLKKEYSGGTALDRDRCAKMCHPLAKLVDRKL